MQTIYAFLGHVFDPAPPRAFNYYIILGVVCAALLAFSIFLRIYSKKHREDKVFKRLFRAYPGKLQLYAVILALYLFFRYTGVPFLSLRFLLYMTLILTVFTLYRMVKTYLKDYPLQKKLHHEQMEKNKYIPRKKHR